MENKKLEVFNQVRSDLSLLSKRDRKSVVQGKSVDLGGRRIIKKKMRIDAEHSYIAYYTTN